jgi:GntR family transcriptional regulator, galactonate operon transcriptional repressor
MHDERAGAPLPGLRDSQSSGGKVHDSIVRIIGGWVLGGRYLPGDTLPREEDLVEQLSVSRTSIREAIKVLAAKGMVESRPRIGVKVRSRDDWRLLDPAVLSWHPNLTRDIELIESLIEVRRIIEPAAAELAARRSSVADVAAIESAYFGMEGSIPGDLDACCEADVAFHRGIVAASHNIVLKSLVGTIEAALKATFFLSTSLMEDQARTLSVHKNVLDCIRRRDTAGARDAMNRLLDLAAQELARI